MDFEKPTWSTFMGERRGKESPHLLQGAYGSLAAKKEPTEIATRT